MKTKIFIFVQSGPSYLIKGVVFGNLEVWLADRWKLFSDTEYQ